MKKRTTKKGLPLRLVALLLCCFCLIAALPTYAVEGVGDSDENNGDNTSIVIDNTAGDTVETQAPTDGVTTTSADPSAPTDTPTGENTEITVDIENTTDETQGVTLSFFDKLTNCTTCAEMVAMLDAATAEELATLGEDELTALIEHVQNMEDDETAKGDLISELTILKDGDATTIPGWGPGDGGGGSNNELNLSKYNSSAVAYWDTTTGTASATGSQDEKITNITLNGVAVEWGDSGDGQQSISGWGGNSYDEATGTGGTALSSYFPNGSTSNKVTSKLSITPAAGYYVTKVVVACLDPNTTSPYGCNTWSAGNAFTANFNVGTSGTVEIDVTNEDFSHSSGSGSYYILIQLAPIPSPLYVEYWPGDITNHTKNTIFSDSDSWTTQGNNNNLGTAGQVHTNYTQFMYKYNNDSSEAANWKHYANSITDAAKAAAADAGYYFTGWGVEYYSGCTATSDGTDDRNYTYTFSTSYGTGAAQPGDDVRLITNCKIIAQWAPIQLQVTKEVKGLKDAGGSGDTLDYTITLKKQNDTNFTDNTQTFTITGDGTLTKTYGAGLTGDNQVNLAITPGTYEIVETGTYDKDGSYYCHTTYETKTVKVTANGTVQVLKVVNTFVTTPPTATLTIKKTVSGNLRDWNKEFTFTVKIGDETETYQLKHEGTQVIENVPVGAQVTVTENPDGYEFSVGSETTVNGTTDNEDYSFTFTMPTSDTTVVFNNNLDAKIETGIILDALPYVLILAIVAGGVVLMLLRRRRSYED